MILDKAIAQRKRSGRAAFIPFVMAGDPAIEWTGRCVRALADAGADVVELGVPFSDPIADGPVNQRAAERALQAGATLGKVLDLAADLRRGGLRIPLVLFTYLNPVLRLGLDSFAARARDAGVSGVLSVDLPPEEAGAYREALGRAGLETVFLASPTTSAARLRLVDEASTGFVYYVSRLGVTGTSAELSGSLAAELKRLGAAVKRPVAVGFGISTPAQAAAAGRLADGVIVGSALVRLAEEHAPEEACRRMAGLAREMISAMEKPA